MESVRPTTFPLSSLSSFISPLSSLISLISPLSPLFSPSILCLLSSLFSLFCSCFALFPRGVRCATCLSWTTGRALWRLSLQYSRRLIVTRSVIEKTRQNEVRCCRYTRLTDARQPLLKTIQKNRRHREIRRVLRTPPSHQREGAPSLETRITTTL